MNFSNFTKISSGNLIYFRNEAPIENVGSIKFYKDNASGTFLKKEMRWSFDRIHWASWEDLNIGNIARINVASNKYLFFEIKYTMTSPTAGKVSSFSVEYLANSGKTYAPPVEDVNMDHGHTLSDGCNDLGGTTKTFEVIKITDAETLCGKSCDYYLWRPNHKGQQPISSITDLQNILNQLISSAGVTQIYVDGSLAARDASIAWLINQNYLKESSLGSGFAWNAGKLDVSVSGDVTKIYIDGSLATRDSSIIYLFDYTQDLSTFIYSADASNLKGVVNIGSGPGEIFKQISGNVAELRTIAAGNANVVVTTVGDQVRISLDSSISGTEVWVDPDPVSADVGGINPGDILDGSTSMRILEKMLYEYFPPNVTLNRNPSTLYFQKWVDAPDVSIFGSFNNYNFVKVKIYDASLFINGIGGLANISYPDVSFGTFAWSDFTPPYGINWDDVIYTVKIYNKVGTMNMQPAEASTSINFVNPYIFGVVPDTINVNNIASSDLMTLYTAGNKIIVPKQTNEVNFIRTSGFKIKFVYAYPYEYGNLSSIFDVQNDFNVTTSFDDTSINLITPWANPSPIPYKVYIKSHWIDVSSFKLIFNI